MPSFRKWSEGFFSAFTHLSQKYAIIISNQYTGFVYAVVKASLTVLSTFHPILKTVWLTYSENSILGLKLSPFCDIHARSTSGLDIIIVACKDSVQRKPVRRNAKLGA